MEIWATTGKDAMDEATATGKVENLGETGMLAKEEWWYPEYMKERCPGLPNWEALKECARGILHCRDGAQGPLSRRSGDLGRLRRGARRRARARFRSGARGNRRGALRRARVRLPAQGADHLWVYAPHWAPAKYKGEWIEFPKYEAGLLQGPGMGHQQDGDPRLRQAARTDLEGRVVRA